jgi:uncharacterized membrane protein YgcG
VRHLAVRLLLALAGLLALALPALAREEITSFDSHATLGTDGTVSVTETIDVNAEGDQIRHGIFRDIFTVLTNPDGSKYYSSLDVVSVQRDGQPETYDTEGITNGERIRIGDADTFVSDGPHRYVIRYTMTRMARFFPDHDELYWNATGNYWQFPIDKATATATLPEGAVISDLVAYVGPPGSQERGTAEKSGPNTATFAASRPLQPGEGLTFAVAFPKGVVSPPAGAGAGLDWLSDHRDTVVPALALLVVLLYNVLAWNRVGRDPKKGTIIPLFHPPEGLSPAATQWVERMGFKGNGWNALTASLFDLGVKGLVTIDNRDGKLSVTGTGAQPAEPLTPDEQVLFDYFGGEGTRVLDKGTGKTLNAKRAAMLAAITRPNRGTWFNLNLGYTIVGFVLGAASLGIMVWLGVLDPGWLVAAIIAGVVVGVVTGVLRSGGGRSAFSIIFIAIWGVVFGINILGTVASLFSSAAAELTPILAAASIVIVTTVFAFLMRAPTRAGRQLMDKIEGFVMYLKTAEQHRLNLEGEPPLTLKRFEAILPFAIALGVEKPWSDKFNAALAANAVPDATGTTYAPIWYSGRDFSSRSLSSNIAAISTAMTSAMAASVPSSSSSSGFSGGGSGGGGGGGGGGGW